VVSGIARWLEPQQADADPKVLNSETAARRLSAAHSGELATTGYSCGPVVAPVVRADGGFHREGLCCGSCSCSCGGPLQVNCSRNLARAGSAAVGWRCCSTLRPRAAASSRI
jgi:hypothetical protein